MTYHYVFILRVESQSGIRHSLELGVFEILLQICLQSGVLPVVVSAMGSLRLLALLHVLLEDVLPVITVAAVVALEGSERRTHIIIFP